MNWIHQAACRGHDPELWFSTRPSKTKTALAVCRTCPVIGECREWPMGIAASTATRCRAYGAAGNTAS